MSYYGMKGLSLYFIYFRLRTLVRVAKLSGTYRVYLSSLLMDQKILFYEREINPGWLSKIFFLNASHNISATLFVSVAFHHNVIFNELLMIIWLEFTFLLSKSPGLQEVPRSFAPPFPTHTHSAVHGQRWGSCGSFQPEAVCLLFICGFYISQD
jgi:hypothetical protein